MVPIGGYWEIRMKANEGKMGMLLTFSLKTPRPMPVPSGTRTGPAEVLLFTGIRYERDSVIDKSKPVRRSRGGRKSGRD